jgi:hypothetical protein
MADRPQITSAQGENKTATIVPISAISLADINDLTGGFIGRFDLPCPLCGPYRRSRTNQRRKVLRIYRIEQSFAGFFCARCGEKGYARDQDARPPDPAKLAQMRAEIAERDRIATADRLKKARGLWTMRRRPARKTIVETYLREVRAIRCALPETLGFLPARDDYPPAMIAGFGFATESEGVLHIRDQDVRGVHITRLKPDGSGKASSDADKIMIGKSSGYPIVLAPMTDSFGLVISEGIENGLSTHEATGLGAWAAGCASRLPALAGVVPSYIECITICADDDEAGRKNAYALAELLNRRGGVEIRIEGLS